MKKLALLFIISLSFQSFALSPEKTDNVSFWTSSDPTNFLGSASIGLALGAVGAAALLAKDALCGVVLKRGGETFEKEFWGRDRILPLAVLVAVPALITGFFGQYKNKNLLDAFR